MDIIENITESLKYPLTDWVKIVILAVISLIPIVNFMSGGYYLRIIKSTLAGVDEVPEFDNLGELFIDGIKMIIVGIVYMLIPLILFVLAFVLSMGSATVSYSEGYSYYAPMAAMSGLSIILMIIGFVIAIILGLIAVIAIANMALYDSEIGAAFRFSEIIGRIKTIGIGNYILWYIAIAITGFIVSLIIGIIGAILMIILIGFLVWFVGGAYLTMFQARSLALLFASSVE